MLLKIAIAPKIPIAKLFIIIDKEETLTSKSMLVIIKTT